MSEERPYWYTLEAFAVERDLGTSTALGLNVDEAAKRLAEYGPNALPEAPPRGIWSMLLAQFKEVLVLVLLAAALVSALLGEAEDVAVILLVVVLNAVLGVVQEARAERSLAALKQLSQPNSTVLRGGHIATVPSAGLVPGDVVLLEAGNFVPADLRLVEAVNLRIDESALTGESVPAEKQTDPVADERAALGDRTNMAFKGTHLTYGRARGIVTATGVSTELGRIAQLLTGQEEEQTPLQKRLAELGKVLAFAALALVSLVFLAGLLRGERMLEMFLTSVSLAVAVVPEGLPAVVTIVLAIGVQRMSRRKAIIRRLPAVETLGSATVICSDKTGTLTQNQMTVVKAYTAEAEYEVTGHGYDPVGEFRGSDDAAAVPASPALRLLLSGLALANDASLERTGDSYRPIGDPTEVALVVLAEKGGLCREDLREMPRLDEIPFDSARKRMTTVHRLDGMAPLPEGREGFVAFTKGGFDVLLPLCTHLLDDRHQVRPLLDEDRDRLKGLNTALAGQALRVLALAYRHYPTQPERASLEQGLTFVGLVGMIDPPRPEAAEAVRVSRRAGIRTIMITGDHQATAAAIAEQLGITESRDQVLTGAELEALDDAELAEAIETTAVFARVAPEHKLRIINALKGRGHVAAMTGDGVNDAPALKRADIGAAMGITGTDVAREAADMVIADDNFATVVAAVREGRTIYANIRKAVQYLLSCNTGELLTILLAILAGLGRPLTAIQILWTNLVTDSLPALALGLEPPEPGVMTRPPRPSNEGILAGRLGWAVLLEGALIGGLTLAGYLLALRGTGDRTVAGTVAFLTLSLSQLVHAFNTRAPQTSLFKIGVFSNRAMVLAFAASAALLFAVTLTPALRRTFDVVSLTGAQWGLVILLSAAPLFVAELRKAVFREGKKDHR